MDIQVSVIIPVYNSEKYIKKCIESLLFQTINECEFIFINDGSTDKSEEIINKYQKIDKRIRYYKQNNSGPSVARNYGIEKSNGKYLMFVDSDDTVSNVYTEKLLKEITENDFDIVCCGYVDESKYGVLSLNDFWKGKNKIVKDEFIKCLCNGVGGVLWGKIFKRDIINNNNIKMNSKIFMSEDLIFILEYCKYASNFGVIDDNLYYYNRLNEKSISSNISIDYIENYYTVVDSIKELLFSLKVDKSLIDNIIVYKIQSLVNTILISESSNYLKIRDKEKFLTNSKLAIEGSFITDYASKFKSYSKLDKIQNYYINKRGYLELLYINVIIISLKKLKDKMLRRS